MSSQAWGYNKVYLGSCGFDYVFIFGVMAIAIASGAIVVLEPNLFIPVLLIDLWLLGYHHVISTFTKLAGTKKDREQNKFLIYELPFLVFGAVVALYMGLGIWSVVTIYFFWQWYHYTRQAYGISAFYRRKSGKVETLTPQKLDYWIVWAVPVWGIVHRCAQGWDTFLFQPVFLPQVPVWLNIAVGVVTCSALFFWLVTKVFDWAKGNLCLAPFLFVMSHHITFFVGYMAISDINAGWLVLNVWHNAQYIMFVWLFNQNRFQSAESKKKSPWLYWLSQRSPYRTLFYFVACIGLTTVVYGFLHVSVVAVSGSNAAMVTALTIIIFQTVNFHHYIVDSLIWKARKKSNQKIMKIDS
ncbi:MAG: hypothetical protein HRT94_07925 [Alphaproteobacteria bacterium]|nr:hypothetical protein [Alphaproteobacteria bacterium]